MQCGVQPAATPMRSSRPGDFLSRHVGDGFAPPSRPILEFEPCPRRSRCFTSQYVAKRTALSNIASSPKAKRAVSPPSLFLLPPF